MKRSFLLKAEAKKAAAAKRSRGGTNPQPADPSGASSSSTPAAASAAGGSRPDPQHSKELEEKILAYDNLRRDKGKGRALRRDYVLAQNEFDTLLSKCSKDVLVITSIPQPVPHDETQCEWIVNLSTKSKILSTKGYPARIPKPRLPDLYELRSTPDMGLGLFAKRDIKRGDLIFAERPLIVVPNFKLELSTGTTTTDPSDHDAAATSSQQIKQVAMSEFESLLETTLARLPPESQADFRALHVVQTGDGSGPLLGIVQTNCYTIRSLSGSTDEKAEPIGIFKIASRLNHSCTPNVKSVFSLKSFSRQFYAVWDIKAGDQLFTSYCTPRGLAERKAELEPYGFVCKCFACVNATPETDRLRNTFEDHIVLLRKRVATSHITESMVEEALQLERDMIKEGLDAHATYASLVTVIFCGYVKLGKMEECKRYGKLIEEFRKVLVDDDEKEGPGMPSTSQVTRK